MPDLNLPTILYIQKNCGEQNVDYGNRNSGRLANVSLLKENLEEGITNLKSQNKGDIIVYGGSTLVSSLINANLIDEYHFIVNPVALGQGLPIFKKLTTLKMVNSIPFECGIIVNHYKKEIEI